MVTLKQLRAAQKLDPTVTVRQLLDRDKNKGVSTQAKKSINIKKVVASFKSNSGSMAHMYPRLKALINGAGPGSSIAAIVRKINAGESNYHLTSYDIEKKKLNAPIDPESNYHETSVDRFKKKYSD